MYWVEATALILPVLLCIAAAIWKIKNTPEAPAVDYQRLKCESPIETRLYDFLVRRGFHVCTQYPCGPYRIDLALPEYSLAIECDGKAWHSTKEQKAHDRKKNSYLRKRGWQVLRFSGSKICKDPQGILKKIQSVI